MTDDDILDGILAHEGPLSNDPIDRGGLTAFGLSFADLTDLLGHPPTLEDAKAVTRERARAFFHARYLAPYACVFDARLRQLLVDAAVLNGGKDGKGWTARTIQAVVGVKQDGAIGPLTLTAINATDPRAAMKAFTRRRVSRLLTTALSDVPAHIRATTQLRFLAGWIGRALDVGLDPL